MSNVVERIKMYAGKEFDKCRHGNPCITKREAIELANYIASIESNGVKPLLCDGWRDITNELPKDNKPVLFYLNNGEYRTGEFVGRAFGFRTSNGEYLGNEHPMDFRANSAPKAWRELPAPPAFA